MLELRTLGAFEVRDDGELLEPSDGVQKKVLAVLTIRRGKPLKADGLVALIWPDDPPENARAEVYNAVCKLRKFRVGPDRRPLVQKNKQGYYVEAESALLDWMRFRELIDLADEAASRGELEVAWKETETALALWHGDEPLEGLDCPYLNGWAGGLKQERADAQDRWCGLGQRLGHHEKVLPVLRRLASGDPLNEPVHEKLMRSLEQTGRRAEALTVYDSVRREVATQLGVYLGPDIQALYARILGPATSTRKG